MVVHGDLLLLIRFMQRQATPGRQELVRDVVQVRELVRSWRGTKVDCLHVVREQNVLADWACGLALQL